MRWYSAEVGDTRIVYRFLFFPRKINNQTRWLESAYIRQRYCLDSWLCGYWIDKDFIDPIPEK